MVAVGQLRVRHTRDGRAAIKVSHRDNRSAYSPEWEKVPRFIGGTITGPKHCLATLLTQNRAVQNTLIVNPIKGCTEINLYDPSHLPTLQCTLRCMRHTKIHHRYPDLSDKQAEWLEVHH